jgi:hypothetical protein
MSMWSPYIGEEVDSRVLLAHTAAPVFIEPLEILPRIIEDGYANGMSGLEIIVKCDGMELATERSWDLGLIGDPNEEMNAERIMGQLCTLMVEAIYQAHLNLRTTITATETHLKTLHHIKNMLSSVTLKFQGLEQIKVTLSMARQILLIKARAEGRAQDNVPEPFRLQIETEDRCTVFDERNRVIGCIAFDPTREEYRTTEGRFGLYNYETPWEDNL